MKSSRACLYTRTSTDEQSLGHDAQLRAMREWARTNKISIVGTFRDDASGASGLDKRPGLTAALALIRKNRSAGAVLVVAKIDRLARDVGLTEMLARELQRSGSSVVSADGVGNGDSPEAGLIRGIFNQFAAYERSIIKARTKAAMQVKISRKEFTGECPYGFRVGPDGVHLVEDPAEQTVIEMMRSLRAGGLSYRALVQELNARGTPARGERWFLSTVHGILARRRAAA